MYYKTKHLGIYCTLGKVWCYPPIRVFTEDSSTIPYEEVDCIANSITMGTYEDCSKRVCQELHRRYGGKIRVRVGDSKFYAETIINNRRKNEKKEVEEKRQP